MIRVMVVVALLSHTLLTSGALVPMVRQVDTNLPNNHSKAASKLPTTQRDLKQQSGRAESTTRGRTDSPSSPPSTSSPSPSTFREEALRLHNHVRRKTEPPAANMPWLRWNSDLAYLAELWSRRCVVDYGLPLSLAPFNYNGRILQNVWSEQQRNGGIGGAVSSWLAEGREFNYGTGACYRAGGCRHYLTMTSATVREVGCGFSKCHDDIMIVCYYGTRSSSQEPDSPLSHYAAGPPCSKCGADEWCDDGLCRSQVKQWKSESADDNCQCDKMEDSSLSDSELDDSALTLGSYTVVLYRHRRQAATNGSTTAPIDCGYLDIPLWIFVGLLAFIVVLGLVIGIIAMCICICKDTCRSCMNRIGRCCRCRGSHTSSHGGRRRNGRKCTIRVIWCRRCRDSREVRPSEDGVNPDMPDVGLQTDSTRDGEDTHDGPTIVEEPPTQVDHASTNTEQRTYQDFGTNTDEVECTATSIEKREFRDIEVQVKAESKDTEVQVTTETKDAEMQVELVEDDKEVNPEDDEREEQENSEDDDGQVPEVPSPSSPSSTSSSSPPSSKSSSSKPRSSSKHPWGKCLDRGCTDCTLHTRDQREVHDEKIETLRKINKANRNPDLKPGDRIF